MPKLYLIDGSGFVHRAFHALPLLLSPKQIPVGAVFGFCQMMGSLLETIKNDKILVVFDKKGSVYRTLLYPAYKATRQQIQDELIVQFPIIKKACQAFGIEYVEREGIEADDLIASYAKTYPGEVFIVSSDKDLMQLVSDRVLMIDPLKKVTFDKDAVFQKLGVLPGQVADFLGLTGDQSDNIPGVPGIGPKTAAELLLKFETIENLLESTHLIPQAKRRERLEEFKDQALLSKQLATLLCDIDPIIPLESLKEHNGIITCDKDFLEEFGFYSLIKRWNKTIDPPTIVSLDDFVVEGYMSFYPKDNGFFVTTRYKGNLISTYTSDLTPFWGAGILKIGCNVDGSIDPPVEDILVLSYTLDTLSVPHDLDSLTKRYVSDTIQNESQAIFLIYEKLQDRIDCEKKRYLYERVERHLPRILYQMHTKGILIDKEYLLDLEKHFNHQLQNLEDVLYRQAGRTFNPGSSKQVGEVLFSDLKYPPPSKGKSGNYKTAYDVLEDLCDQGVEIASTLLKWRELSKLQSTYVVGLLNKINPKTGAIHTSFSSTGTATGRLSSSHPNLQNIPVKTEEGRKIRHAFVARPGHFFCSFDYSQVELRLLSHFSQELLDAFAQGLDIHQTTASHMFKIPLDQVSKDQRRMAKTVNFGILYGMSAFSLSKQLHCSIEDATSFIETYFKTYPKILDFIQQREDEAQKNGFVTTLLGRKCFTPGIHSKNHNHQSFAKRQAINAPLQGSNADIIKRAMVRLLPLLENDGVNLLLQVHDELLFELQDDAVINDIKNIMMDCDELSIPLVLDIKKGNRWDEL